MDETNQKYYPHFKNASSIALTLLVGSLKTFTHAVYPDVFENSATNTINKVNKNLKKNTDSIELLNIDNFVGDNKSNNEQDANNEQDVNNERIINNEQD